MGKKRVSVIVTDELWEKLKDYAYTERISISETADRAVRAYLADKKNILKRPPKRQQVTL